MKRLGAVRLAILQVLASGKPKTKAELFKRIEREVPWYHHLWHLERRYTRELRQLLRDGRVEYLRFDNRKRKGHQFKYTLKDGEPKSKLVL